MRPWYQPQVKSTATRSPGWIWFDHSRGRLVYELSVQTSIEFGYSFRREDNKEYAAVLCCSGESVLFVFVYLTFHLNSELSGKEGCGNGLRSIAKRPFFAKKFIPTSRGVAAKDAGQDTQFSNAVAKGVCLSLKAWSTRRAVRCEAVVLNSSVPVRFRRTDILQDFGRLAAVLRPSFLAISILLICVSLRKPPTTLNRTCWLVPQRISKT